MKKAIVFFLKSCAKALLKKYDPVVVGITGSVGKTSAKEAIFSVVSGSYAARRNRKSFNNEIGVPLTIIGCDSPGKSVRGWMGVFGKAVWQLIKFNRDYPEVLVLEMGADRPHDISYLTGIAPCRIGVLTKISPVHLEFFGSIDKIFEEKQKILTHIGAGGWAVFNGDEELIRTHLPELRAQVMTFGFDELNTVRATDVKMSYEKKKKGFYYKGIQGKVHYGQTVVPFFLPGVIGRHQVYAALAAVAVGAALDINLVKISESLRMYHPPRGRMNVLEGVRHTQILDDTYNASPASVKAALDTLISMPCPAGNKRVAVLGDMLELGAYTEDAHREVGAYAAQVGGIDMVAVWGERARDIVRGAREAGMPKDRLFQFEKQQELIGFLKRRLNQGDCVLVKGSRAMHMENIVKGLLAHPESAEELLVE